MVNGNGSMNLIVDIGNSRIKVVVMAGDSVVEEYVSADVNRLWLKDIVDGHKEICRAIVSSTSSTGAMVAQWLSEMVEYTLLFEPATTPVPIANSYTTPQTLGADRLAAAVGGVALFPDGDLMIVDFGTAITIDYVVDGGFVGGNISPGVTTRFRALADYTAKLPLCSPTDEVLTYGRTTREAIEQGVMQGITNEIEGYIEAFLCEKEKKYIIFTGGDAKYFVKRIKNTIFAGCEPVIYGLNRILNYNADKI
jgi:type III pantothenate kinase